jgi:DNA-binding CsgD family transcriptional regulator/N-acetylneuraminic acid mutarotase
VSEPDVCLSDREMQILQLVATGATNQQIARELVISVNTVKVHLRNIYAKLQVSSRTEATIFAVSEGWVEVPRTLEGLGEEGALVEAPAFPQPDAVLSLERWPRVPMLKRMALVVGVLLMTASLALPMVTQGKANNSSPDPIRGVFPSVAGEAGGSRWRTRAQMPTPRTNLAVVAHNGLIYAIGGASNTGVTGKVEIYDPRSDAWTTGGPKPTPAGFVSAVVVDGLIYVPGGIGDGQQPRSDLEVYDPATDAWQTRAALPQALGAYGLAAMQGEIFMFGGWDGRGYVASVYHYSPAADSWQALQPMDLPRGFLGAASVGDRIYVVGGYDGITEFNSCSAYDPLADTWAPLATMDLRRGGLTLVPVRESLYALGGGINGYLAFNERYDPRINIWTRVETPVAAQWWGLGGALVDLHIYAIGGWNGTFLSVNEAYQAIYQWPSVSP